MVSEQDLENLKNEEVKEIGELRKLLEQVTAMFNPPRQWLKSYEVRDLMGISGGTLQNMRNNGTLASKKVGGLMYYKYSDILKLMEG
ncbi:helix-turn-helix domain-containing protein [Chitinophaga sp. CC14]|uniref:helix-turn-helix domain-containing protein n=1 Tax=Chitinophaga sp. CC14 TaxID=3029199 RepID=UPI003B7F5E4B